MPTELLRVENTYFVHVHQITNIKVCQYNSYLRKNIYWSLNSQFISGKAMKKSEVSDSHFCFYNKPVKVPTPLKIAQGHHIQEEVYYNSIQHCFLMSIISHIS